MVFKHVINDAIFNYKNFRIGSRNKSRNKKRDEVHMSMKKSILIKVEEPNLKLGQIDSNNLTNISFQMKLHSLAESHTIQTPNFL